MQQGTSRVTTDSNQRLAQSAAPKPKLLDQVRHAIRARHYSKRTERTYADWIKRFILFQGKRHPLEMGEPEVQPIFHFPFAICHLSLKIVRSS
jgi:hypothetical protein